MNEDEGECSVITENPVMEALSTEIFNVSDLTIDFW